MDGWTLAKYTIGAIIGVVALGIVAKDGDKLGSFLTSTSQAFTSFGTGLGSIG